MALPYVIDSQSYSVENQIVPFPDILGEKFLKTNGLTNRIKKLTGMKNVKNWLKIS